jgi:hypothetical protein
MHFDTMIRQTCSAFRGCCVYCHDVLSPASEQSGSRLSGFSQAKN